MSAYIGVAGDNPARGGPDASGNAPTGHSVDTDTVTPDTVTPDTVTVNTDCEYHGKVLPEVSQRLRCG